MTNKPASNLANTDELRQKVIDAAITLNTSGINQGLSGNVSVRTTQGFFITPSGMAYSELAPNDIVFMDFSGNSKGERKPSSEWRFHLDIYVNQEKIGHPIGAIVHTHSTYATALACLNKRIPAFHYMVAAAGGYDIRCAPYATYGTQELSEFAVTALLDRKACLLGHHGVIATGEDLNKALNLAGEVESLAHQYIETLKIGEPEILSQQEMDIVIKKFKSYGANAQ